MLLWCLLFVIWIHYALYQCIQILFVWLLYYILKTTSKSWWSLNDRYRKYIIIQYLILWVIRAYEIKYDEEFYENKPLRPYSQKNIALNLRYNLTHSECCAQFEFRHCRRGQPTEDRKLGNLVPTSWSWKNWYKHK